MIWQAHRSERPITVFLCATAPRLAAGRTGSSASKGCRSASGKPNGVPSARVADPGRGESHARWSLDFDVHFDCGRKCPPADRRTAELCATKSTSTKPGGESFQSGLLRPRRPNQQVGGRLVRVVQLAAVAIAGLADTKGAAGQRNSLLSRPSHGRQANAGICHNAFPGLRQSRHFFAEPRSEGLPACSSPPGYRSEFAHFSGRDRSDAPVNAERGGSLLTGFGSLGLRSSINSGPPQKISRRGDANAIPLPNNAMIIIHHDLYPLCDIY